MKINLKARLKNKTFVLTMATLIVTFVYQLLAMFEIVPSISQSSVVSVIGMVVNLLAALGVVVDPTTEGVGDSERALTYYTDEDVRLESFYDDSETPEEW